MTGAIAGSSWGVPAALVMLSLVPVVAGSLRVLEIAGGPQMLPANSRIDAVPAPVVVHIMAAALYAILGAFQFSARLRRRRPNWHRRSMSTAVSVSSGWVVNAAVAEWVIRRPSTRRARRARTHTALVGSR